MKQLTYRAICLLTLAVALPSLSSAANVALLGSWTYSITDATVVLTADGIQNFSSFRSGSLKLELWASPNASGLTPSSVKLAEYPLTALNSGAALSSLSTGSLAYTPPQTPGLWFYYLIITEFTGSSNNSGYSDDNYYRSDAPVVCASAAFCSSGNMTNHGGTVQHGQKVYTIFWSSSTNSFPSGYQATINQFVQDLNGSTYYATATQYGDNLHNISPLVSFGGTWLDSSGSFGGAVPTTTAVINEVGAALAANSWAIDQNSFFLVYTPAGLTNGIGACGYHANSGLVPFGLIPFPTAAGSGTCLSYSFPWPNGQVIDSAISTSAHEIAETVTDPFGNAWSLLTPQYGEIGDLCVYQTGPRNSSGADLILNGHGYLVQMLWSNAASGCVIGSVIPSLADQSPPLLTITTKSQTASTSSITISGTATDAGQGDNGISYVAINGLRANGDAASGSGTANWSQTITLNPGPNKITVSAADNSPAGNVTTSSITITFTLIVAPATSSATANTYHVFPQFADGRFSDGSYYRTTLMISNPSATAGSNCTLQLRGLTIPSLPTNYSMSASGWVIQSTPGTQPLQTGYASLQCSNNVEAQLLYSYYSSSGVKLSEATVFSSPSASIVKVIADERESAHLGLAIANDSDQAVTYTISATNAISKGAVTLQPRTSVARFLSEFVPGLPSNSVGIVTVGGSSGKASIIGLRYTGNIFTTIPESQADGLNDAVAGTYHVFPQFADGKFSDGTYYKTTRIYSDPSTSLTVNCVTQLYGMTTNGVSTITGILVPGSAILSSTTGTQAFQSGYATMQCSSSVDSQALYSYYDANGAKLSEATVFSSPSARTVQILSDSREGAQVGLAIANDTDQTNTYTISVFDATGNVVGTATETLDARRSIAKFVSEFVKLPPNHSGPVIVSSNSITGAASIIGLRFTGSAFTTIPETIR